MVYHGIRCVQTCFAALLRGPCWGVPSEFLWHVERKVGGKFHLKLNIGSRPIASKYHEGKVKRTNVWTSHDTRVWSSCYAALRACLWHYRTVWRHVSWLGSDWTWVRAHQTQTQQRHDAMCCNAMWCHGMSLLLKVWNMRMRALVATGYLSGAHRQKQQ